MAIVKMRKVRVAAAEEERKKLFRALLHLGCVEILPPEPLLEEEALDGLVSRFQEDSAVEDRLRQLRQGIAALQEIAHPRKKLFAPRQQVTESELLEGGIQETLTLANLLMERAEQLRQIREELARLDVRMARLMPWRQLDLPLEFRESRCTVAELGTLPPAANLTALSDALAEQAPVSALQVLQGDREQQRICLVAHRDQADAAMTVLKEFGFSRVTFEEQGAPEVVLHRLHQRRQTLEERQRALIQEVTEQSNRLPELERAYDAVLQEQATAREREKLLRTRQAFYFEGWMPADQEGQISTALDRFICAYEFADPEDGEDVPVRLRNTPLVAPMSMVTEMYSLPAYEGIDPNPLIFPFFTVFFGIMYADLGYGLILFCLGLAGLKLLHPRGMMDQMLRLMVLCGVTTAAAGACFGGFFGDVITVVAAQFGVEAAMPALIFNPLEQPMTMLVVSLVLGAIHILTGMVVKAYLCFRDGHPLDAVLDVGSWWLLFAGFAVLALDGSWWLAAAGALALVLTQGRSKPTLIGKFVGGLASLYDITSYLSDILSYLRLMALALATSVIASVVNTLGVMTGFVGFVVIFLVGHAFNMGINIIGTYVHAARLQYLEFFGKFYQEGGRPFQPYQMDTKYVDVIKEEKVS